MFEVNNYKDVVAIKKISDVKYEIILNKDIILSPYERKLILTGLFIGDKNNEFCFQIRAYNDFDANYILLFGDDAKFENTLINSVNIENILYAFNLTGTEIIIKNDTVLGEIYVSKYYFKDITSNKSKDIIYSANNVEVKKLKENCIDRVEYSENYDNEKMVIVYLKE